MRVATIGSVGVGRTGGLHLNLSESPLSRTISDADGLMLPS